MLTGFVLFTVIATIATIAPVYNFRKRLAKLFKVPYLGWIFSLSYSYAISWIMLNIFSFRSSMAGLANMAASILFSLWLYFQQENVSIFENETVTPKPAEKPQKITPQKMVSHKKHSTNFIS